MAYSSPHDPGHADHTDDPELQKTKEDTAHIFVQFVRLHSHSASSNTAVIDRICPSSSPTETPPTPCLQPQESSRDTTAAGHSTLPRQKSTEAAARKDPHPKAVYSTRQPAQIVTNPHCSVEASTPVPPGQNTKSSRPDKLSLPHVHKRVPSATGSDHSSGKTTPAQDPPMELMSPGAAGELSSSYPPLSTAPSDRGTREWLIRSAEHATVAAASSSQASCTTTSSQEKDRHFSSAVSIMCWLC